MKMLSRPAAAVLAGAALADPTTSQAQPATATVYALVAANATDAFNDLIAVFERRHPGVTVRANYAGTQILQTQLEQGAPGDVFLSADREHIEKLAQEGLVDRYAVVARIHEVIVVPKGDPAGIRDLRDLGTKKFKLVIGVPTVPIGEYTRAIFTSAERDYGNGFASRALANVVSMETNVKQIVQKVALGEADAGVVYVTDVTPELRERLRIIEIPRQFNVPATNYIAVTRQPTNPALARELVDLALSPQGQDVFRRFGYDPAK